MFFEKISLSTKKFRMTMFNLSYSQCLVKYNNISHKNKIKIKNLKIKKIKTAKVSTIYNKGYQTFFESG